MWDWSHLFEMKLAFCLRRLIFPSSGLIEGGNGSAPPTSFGDGADSLGAGAIRKAEECDAGMPTLMISAATNAATSVAEASMIEAGGAVERESHSEDELLISGPQKVCICSTRAQSIGGKYPDLSYDSRDTDFLRSQWTNFMDIFFPAVRRAKWIEVRAMSTA